MDANASGLCGGFLFAVRGCVLRQGATWRGSTGFVQAESMFIEYEQEKIIEHPAFVVRMNRVFMFFERWKFMNDDDPVWGRFAPRIG
ncbi:hypothetical protein SAMN05192564_103301 [Paraburkholderia sartisoli]|uniref:Uncharacterized protein n=1 Tax=Paraburkholderia sartisoli TaxID=83784 RepID=A0A1H4EFJ6_9BURK|nr:hypothetical protein SAMN05192564_103301 [Paraburkholderia sartisoli]